MSPLKDDEHDIVLKVITDTLGPHFFKTLNNCSTIASIQECAADFIDVLSELVGIETTKKDPPLV